MPAAIAASMEGCFAEQGEDLSGVRKRLPARVNRGFIPIDVRRCLRAVAPPERCNLWGREVARGIEGGESLRPRSLVLATGVTGRRLEIGGTAPGSLSPFGPNVSRSPRS